MPASQPRHRITPRWPHSLLAATCLWLTFPAATPAQTERPPGCEFAPGLEWPALREVPAGQILLEADQVKHSGERFSASGDVSLFQNGRRLDTERLQYDRNRQELNAIGATRVFDGDLLLNTDGGHLRLDTETGEFRRIKYLTESVPARGSAARGQQTAPGTYHFEAGEYTTCPLGDDSWWLRTGELELDQERGVGVARHARIHLKGVPIAYTPYISFPLDDRRKSGFLLPSAGTGGRTGLDLSLPWYWNIAPNLDATLTPRIMSDRGVMLGTEFRYLRPRHRGEIILDYLPDDRETRSDRQYLHWQHRTRITPELILDVDAADASDSEYFRDFGGSDRYSGSTPYLERRADLTLSRPNYRLRTRLQEFQLLDPELRAASAPYQRLPQVTLEAGEHLGRGLSWDLDTELVRFELSHRDPARPSGTRLDLDPELAWRYDTGGLFVEPRIGLRHTRYELDRHGRTGPESLTRTLPRASLDTGLIFEREIGGGTRLQTLEPRLFYGYVPYRDQDAIPLFDTGEIEFGFDSLFELDRFAGVDRVGDTHQMTTALTTRILDTATGREHLSLSAGQIHYLADRKVRRHPDEPPHTSARSELGLEGRARISETWSGRASILYDPDRDETTLASVNLGYQPRPEARLNLGYRQREDTRGRAIEQTDASVLWPVTSRVRAIGRWNYSLQEGRDLELLAGLQYRSCCYGLRVVARRALAFDETYDNSIYFQLTLDGLARFDAGVDTLLREGIAGYESNLQR